MERIKRFNQIILAVFGSLAVIGLAFILVFAVVEIIKDWQRDSKRRPNNDLRATPTVTRQNDTLKTQDLVYGMPILLDTIPELYLITVSQVSLGTPEDVHAEEEMISYGRIRNEKYSSRIRSQRTGKYNNLIVFNGLGGEKTTVFNEKCMVSSYQYCQLNNVDYLLIEGTTKDSNGDGKLTYKDLSSLFVYDINKHLLKELTQSNHGFISHQIVYNSDELVVKFGKDVSKNGEFESYEEPNLIMRYNMTTGMLQPLISKSLNQKLIENINL